MKGGGWNHFSPASGTHFCVQQRQHANRTASSGKVVLFFGSFFFFSLKPNASSKFTQSHAGKLSIHKGMKIHSVQLLPIGRKTWKPWKRLRAGAGTFRRRPSTPFNVRHKDLKTSWWNIKDSIQAARRHICRCAPVFLAHVRRRWGRQRHISCDGGNML